MRLNKLEIKGFKSFADKTTINFDDNVVAIMGPNGCGKSNIIDAIRWVLGEQRAKTLRLEKMDNIIFNGTKDRKAGNLAEVSLTFDNTKNIIPTEFSNITITRTIYRTGESEYKINGVSCRLKDIKNLFLDTGIGSNTYAIMELKMIDNILNDVDNSRRSLIEQAAGISKYKARKRETLQKLNSTEADLNRVEDLLFEIQSNLKELESQARKATRYKKLKEDYKILSVDLAKYDILDINDQYEAIAKSHKELEDQRLNIESSLQKKEAGLQKLKTDILGREKTLSEEQKSLNEFINSIQEKESDKKVSEQKLNFLQNRIQTISSEITEHSSEQKRLNEDIEELDERVKKEAASLEGLKKVVDTAKQELEQKRTKNISVKDALDRQRHAFVSVRNVLNESEKQIAIRESRLESMKSSIQRSLFEKEERLESLKKLEVEVSKVSKVKEKQLQLIESLEKKEEGNVKNIDSLESKIEKQRNQVIDFKRTLDAKGNEYRLTKNMVDSLEGFPHSIKYLKKSADWLKETPLLSDILYCEEKYRVAIELVLQPYLNHFIVSSEKEAEEAIQLLHKSSKGRAHFFVLDHFKNLITNKSHFKPSLDQILALDIIEVDDLYQPLLSFLLKDVVIIPSDTGLLDYEKLNKSKTSDSIFYVVESGKWIQSEVEISGGAVGLFEGKRLGRVKNLEKLAKEIQKLQETVKKGDTELKERISELNHLKNNSFRKTIDREFIELQKYERQLVSHQSRIENFQDFVDQHSRRNQEVEGNISGLEGEIKVLQGKFEEATKASEIHQLKVDSLENDFKAVSMEFSKQQEQFNEKNILFIQNENALNSYKQSKSFKEARLIAVNNEVGKNKEESVQSKDEIENIKKSLIELDDLLVNLYLKRDERKLDLSGHENSYYELKEHVQNEEDQIREETKLREEIDFNIQQKKDKRNNLKYELQSLRQRLSLEFKIDVESLLETLEKPEIEKPELQLKLDRVGRRIDNFGDVNPMAEVAYEEMNKRFTFISTQKEDLEEAKESLLATIEEIEATAKEHFMDSFVAIRENFKNVFRSMFNEHDKCDLILLNPDDPLESKVEIVAKPKGKRPQSINQLSGGEKSLTALSLLFALYLYKPAPFCILDEIDAPLDFANVQKFNKAIRNFSKDSQFIIVSHKPATGASADTIYGVTMQKTGISLLAPTKTKDFKDHEIAQAS